MTVEELMLNARRLPDYGADDDDGDDKNSIVKAP